MAGSGLYRFGRMAGVQFRKAQWMRQSVAGSEAEGVFDLRSGPLLGALLVRFANDEHALIVTVHHIAVDGEVVFLDHTEKWTFTSGETAEHTFASMHEMKDGLIYRWSDYWDMQKFVSQFPEWFIEEMIKASADDFTD